MSIGLLDVKVLYLGIKNNDTIDDRVLSSPEIAQIGTGRVLDALAELVQKRYIKLNDDKSFQILPAAKYILWSEEVPLWVRVLRILDMSSSSLQKIAQYLNQDGAAISEQLESLRKSQLVLMSALRNGDALEQTFEILPEGRQELEKINKQGFSNLPNLQKTDDVHKLLDDITNAIQTSNIDQDTKQNIFKMISAVKTKLYI